MRASANRDTFTSSSVCIPFNSIFCLTFLAKISNTILHKNGEIGHHHLISDFHGNAMSFFTYSVMLVIVFFM